METRTHRDMRSATYLTRVNRIETEQSKLPSIRNAIFRSFLRSRSDLISSLAIRGREREREKERERERERIATTNGNDV